jgi:glycosyltransferase involved in cell wall biosynthesis
MKTEISVVIAVRNEEKNILPLHKALTNVLHGRQYEIIFVDDGSIDSTFKHLQSLHHQDGNVKVIKFRRSYGQTMAWRAGFKQALGDIVVTMDGDLQNDPADIPRMLEKLNEGFDVVSGWRSKRKDKLSKKALSKVAEYMRRLLTDDRIHDAGCALKLYKRECLQNLQLYGEMHRFITTLLTWQGYRIGEIKVAHHPRRFGNTKYNYKRLVKGFLDLINARFWMSYSTRPIHFFGIYGLLLIIAGIVLGILNIGYYLFLLKRVVGVGPLLLLAGLLVLVGFQFIMFGFLGEMQIRSYYESTGTEPYSIEKILE